MDNGDRMIFIRMWVCIKVGDATVRCPPRMGDGEGRGLKELASFNRAYLSDVLFEEEFVIRFHRHSP